LETRAREHHARADESARVREERTEEREESAEERKESAEEEKARRRRNVRERVRARNETVIERVEQKSEDLAESAGDKIWKSLRRRPYLGVAITAAGGVGIATVFGVAELAFGVAVGYVAYLVLKKRMPPSEALRETIRIRRRG
jgi:hypothetical protein